MEKLKQQSLEVLRYARKLGMAHAETTSHQFNGRIMEVKGQQSVSFSLCDYMGLSTDVRLREGAAKAAMDYGVYTAVSRSFLKLQILAEAEERMSEIFGHPTLVVPRTTLGHLSVMPAIISPKDLIILDHQVHTSVKLAAQNVAAAGTEIITVRHNQMDALEELLINNQNDYRRIWYMADGVYSMYGDALPVTEVEALLNKYDNFYLFVDDAHGMSWIGERGVGYCLSNMDLHPKMVLNTSLGKGFGSGGGAIVCYDQDIRDEIEILGAPIMFSSPISPPTLGAIIASAKIHMSDEIYKRQELLSKRIAMVRSMAKDLKIPVILGEQTPIIYIASGQPNMTSEIGHEMMKKGFHFTGGVFPAVPFNNAGVRIVVTLHQKEEETIQMLEIMSKVYYQVLEKNGKELGKVLRHYKNVEFSI